MGIVYWSPLSIFVSLNKKLESGGGGTKICVFVLPIGGRSFENFTCLKRGQRKNIITVACEQALFELALKFEREPAGLANKNASVRCLERRRASIG